MVDSYIWYSKDKKGSFELDFGNGMTADSRQNELNILRIYAAILVGYQVKISTSEKSIYYTHSKQVISPDLVAQITRLGCVIFNKYTNPNDYEYNGIERKLNSMMNKFFKDTDASRSVIRSNDHLLLPYSHPYAFFDILFMARNNPPKNPTPEELIVHKKLTQKLKYGIINDYVDFVKLGKMMEQKDPNSAQARAWVRFKTLVGNDLSRVKIDNNEKLKAFLESVLTTHPSNLNEIASGNVYFVDPATYEVDPEFHTALYLDGYLK